MLGGGGRSRSPQDLVIFFLCACPLIVINYWSIQLFSSFERNFVIISA